MSAVDQHTEAHRLKAERGWGARKIGEELGISRHAATLLLAQPLAEERQPPAATPAEVAAGPADERRPVPPLRVDLSRRPRLLADLTELSDAGMRPHDVVDAAVGALAAAYRRAVARGAYRPGDRLTVSATVSVTVRRDG